MDGYRKVNTRCRAFRPGAGFSVGTGIKKRSIEGKLLGISDVAAAGLRTQPALRREALRRQGRDDASGIMGGWPASGDVSIC
jgi:hypothetical protein